MEIHFRYMDSTSIQERCVAYKDNDPFRAIFLNVFQGLSLPSSLMTARQLSFRCDFAGRSLSLFRHENKFVPFLWLSSLIT